MFGLQIILSLAACAGIVSSQSTGCGTKHVKKGTLRHDHLTTSDGDDREFVIWIPPTYDENDQHPLVLSFHGNGKDMNSQATLSRFTEPAINPNMIAVFPNGLFGDTSSTRNKRCWHGAPYCYSHNDTLFVTELLQHMSEQYCVDPSRIYATGKSIGGGFVDILACTTSPGGEFAAFGMDAAAMYKEADDVDPKFICTPARPSTPILELHGTEDKIATYTGTRSHGYTLPNVRDVLNTWAIRNGCGESPVPAVDEVQMDGQVYYTQYDCAGVPNVVVGYNVTGQGHWWISNESNAENGNNLAPIDASTIMMKFFNANSKPAKGSTASDSDLLHAQDGSVIAAESQVRDELR